MAMQFNQNALKPLRSELRDDGSTAYYGAGNKFLGAEPAPKRQLSAYERGEQARKEAEGFAAGMEGKPLPADGTATLPGSTGMPRVAGGNPAFQKSMDGFRASMDRINAGNYSGFTRITTPRQPRMQLTPEEIAAGASVSYGAPADVPNGVGVVSGNGKTLITSPDLPDPVVRMPSTPMPESSVAASPAPAPAAPAPMTPPVSGMPRPATATPSTRPAALGLTMTPVPMSALSDTDRAWFAQGTGMPRSQPSPGPTMTPAPMSDAEKARFTSPTTQVAMGNANNSIGIHPSMIGASKGGALSRSLDRMWQNFSATSPAAVGPWGMPRSGVRQTATITSYGRRNQGRGGYASEY